MSDRPSSADSATDRRGLLRRTGAAGGALAGASLASLFGARPVGAADGQPVVSGTINTASSPTELAGAGTGERHVLTVSDLPGATTTAPAAVGGRASGVSVDNGVSGYTDSANGADLGDSGHALIGFAQGEARAQLYLGGALPDPRFRAGYGWDKGTLVNDVDGNLWHSVESGTGVDIWRLVSGPRAAGAFVPIDPSRVYDSRFAGAGGRMLPGTSRFVTVRDRIDVTTGDVVESDVVPLGATAVSFNVAVAQTSGTGFLFVAPSDVAGIQAATINWSDQAPGPLANSSVVRLPADRRLRIFAGPTGSCEFVIDVVGYHL